MSVLTVRPNSKDAPSVDLKCSAFVEPLFRYTDISIIYILLGYDVFNVYVIYIV